MNSSTLTSGTLSHSPGQRASESQDSELTSVGNQTSKVLNQMKSELQEQKQQDRLLRELHLKRVQSLRKELDYIKATEWRYQPIDSLLNYTIGSKSSSTNETEQINNVLECIENAYKKETEENEYSGKDSCDCKTGNITFTAADYVVIDNVYVCDTANSSISNLKVGDTVCFLTSKNSDERKHKVEKIISVLDDSKINNVVNSPVNIIKSETATKCVIGKVTERKNRLLIVEPNNICVDLNKVKSEFIPVIGDWLQLESEVIINESSYNCDKDTLDIKKIQPLRNMLNVGTVTSYDAIKEVGVIGKDIVFNKKICDCGYIPVVGDKVISDNIESDQGIYTWRSLTVVPVCEVPGKDTKLTSSSLSNSFKINKNLTELVKNKHDIVISDNTKVDLSIQEEKSITLTLENVGNTIQILNNGCFMMKKAHSQLSLLKPTINAYQILHPSERVTYIFKCKAKFIGTSEELFIFNFQGFQIGRIFNITIKPKTIQRKSSKKDITKVNKCYVADLEEWNQATYIPGIRPCKPPLFIKVRNVVFRVPKHYWNIMLTCMNEKKSSAEIEREIENAIPCLSNRLCFESYKDRFHALLYLEEIAQIINMQQYRIESTILKHSGEYLVMQVPGLAEKRPSLLIGDRAIVSFKWDDTQGKLKYEGFIHKVTNLDIFLKFNPKFHQQYNSEDCEVTFKCSQSAIQRCHNAVNMATQRLGQNFLFPTHVVEKESQIDIEEYETKEKPVFKPITHQRSDSVSSESSFTSNTTTSNKTSTTKSSTKMSVVQRLFNVTPVEHNPCTMIKSDTGITNHQCPETKIITNARKESVNTSPLKDPKEISSISSSNTELRPIISQVRKRKLRWFNKNLNYYQMEAVKNILRGQARPLPYVIFGPPGTGKTVTLCEAILQILSIMPESRLLIATPSNSSANLISERLLDSGILKPGDMVRLLAHHYLNSDSISSKLLPYCATAEIADEATIEKRNDNSIGPRLNCTMSVLGRHRITVGTCIAVAILKNMGFPRGHFSHIVIDEAGQAMEPEIMIPLNFIHSDYGQVVLAGDPLQLGPVIQSRIAQNLGLGESFLSRLLRHFPYQRDPIGFERQYDPRLVTKLVINYRSLPEILELSSSLFYNSELIAQVSPKNSKEAEILQKLASELPKRKGGPPAIIFHGVNGENCKDNDSPSWYNAEEATQAYLYMLKLYKCNLSPDDIGIITPYQKQVHQIRELLTELDVELPKISSVEGFQGQERNVIIISTVRSSTNFVNEDIKHSLGFVACPQRLNVAITRARALVIILGNPKLLAQDPYWRTVLIYCINQDSYTGCNFGFYDLEDYLMSTNNSYNSDKINNDS